MGETKDDVSEVTQARVLKKQRDTCNQHKIKAYQLSGFCSWCLLLGLENRKSICVRGVVPSTWQFEHRTLYVKISYLVLWVHSLRHSLNSNWSYKKKKALKCTGEVQVNHSKMDQVSRSMTGVGVGDRCTTTPGRSSPSRGSSLIRISQHITHSFLHNVASALRDVFYRSMRGRKSHLEMKKDGQRWHLS